MPAPAPTANPTATPSAPAVPIAAQVAEHVRALAAGDARFHVDGAHLEVALTPADLGRVGIRTRRGDDGVVRIDIRCADPDTAKALATTLDDLRHHLGDVVGGAAVAVRHGSETITAASQLGPTDTGAGASGGGHGRPAGHAGPDRYDRDPAAPGRASPDAPLPPARAATTGGGRTTLDIRA